MSRISGGNLVKNGLSSCELSSVFVPLPLLRLVKRAAWSSANTGSWLAEKREPLTLQLSGRIPGEPKTARCQEGICACGMSLSEVGDLLKLVEFPRRKSWGCSPGCGETDELLVEPRRNMRWNKSELTILRRCLNSCYSWGDGGGVIKCGEGSGRAISAAHDWPVSPSPMFQVFIVRILLKR
jgi:hypothetical protein